MIKTKLCELLGIKYPIIQAGMGPFQTQKLAQAVANAGALGIISTSGIIFGSLGVDLGPLTAEKGDPYDVVTKYIREVGKGTKKGATFGINVMVSAELSTPAREFVRAAVNARDENADIREGLKVIITSAGDPLLWTDVIKPSGLKWFHVVPSVRHAKRAEKAGVDAVIASGHEGGGHVAWEPVHTMAILPSVVNAVGVPVIGAGGFCDGATLAAALALGAVGIQMGTRFVGTKEADTCFGDIWKNRLLKTDERSTIVARGFVGPLRYLRNEASVQLARLTVEKVPNLFVGQPDITLDQALLATEMEGHRALAGEDDEKALFYGGEVAGRIQDIPSVKELIERIAEEAEKIIKELPGKVIV